MPCVFYHPAHPNTRQAFFLNVLVFVCIFIIIIIWHCCNVYMCVWGVTNLIHWARLLVSRIQIVGFDHSLGRRGYPINVNNSRCIYCKMVGLDSLKYSFVCWLSCHVQREQKILLGPCSERMERNMATGNLELLFWKSYFVWLHYIIGCHNIMQIVK